LLKILVVILSSFDKENIEIMVQKSSLKLFPTQLSPKTGSFGVSPKDFFVNTTKAVFDQQTRFDYHNKEKDNEMNNF
jgi:hypothetical protein